MSGHIFNQPLTPKERESLHLSVTMYKILRKDSGLCGIRSSFIIICVAKRGFIHLPPSLDCELGNESHSASCLQPLPAWGLPVKDTHSTSDESYVAANPKVFSGRPI